MKNTIRILAITLLSLCLICTGCGNNDTDLSTRNKISLPREALIGHWSQEYGDDNLYFDGEHLIVSVPGKESEKIIASWYYMVINEDPDNFIVEIELDMGQEITRILKVEFSEDRNRITMKYWKEPDQEYVETDMSKESIIYVDDRLFPR